MLVNNSLDSFVEFRECRLVIVNIAIEEASNAKICECNLVSSSKLLSVLGKSALKQISTLFKSSYPFVVAFFGPFWGESIAGNYTKNGVILAEVEKGVDLPHAIRIGGVITKFDCKRACSCLGLVHFDSINCNLWE